MIKSGKHKKEQSYGNVIDGLRRLYKSKLLPLEEAYRFHEFHSPQLEDADFEAKPMVLLVGQYSTGKTTFIKYLIEQDYPGLRIGPEPTTDRFIAVMHNDVETVVPGNALVVDPKRQFRPLSKFGNAFLNRFQCSCVPNAVLESISFIDSPGILSGEKQRADRGYDFTGVIEWFAERVDRIILLFDAHKLDISDEFKKVIDTLRNHDDKIRIVLNKSDRIDHQQLMRVYGALMWSLGKVFRTPEVTRVYIGTFWNEPLHYDSNRRLFELEEQDLFKDLQSLPRQVAVRKLNDLIKRARLAKVHALIISSLKKEMPSMFGKEKQKKELIANLEQTYKRIEREHGISMGDFPNLARMKEQLANQDFSKFNELRKKMLDTVDDMLAIDIAQLMQMIPREESEMAQRQVVKGGAFATETADNPFQFARNEGIDRGKFDVDWVVARERVEFDETFRSLNPVNGKITGAAAKQELMKSKLPFQVLGKVWKLSDVDEDGMLDIDEFALASYLIKLKLEGHEVPNQLPAHLIPPSKRDLVPANQP